MKLKSILNDSQIDFVKNELPGLPVDIDVNSEKYDVFCEGIETYYQTESFDEKYNITAKGKLAEGIIDLLTDKGYW
ncbi:TPA: hypothetical protein VID84_001352 [Streptococcus pyogenes]|uniref:hypothetical protein n=1 Tax=Streptococcus pyogenes TaxID=1314 RepID=UPI00109C2A6C|nr:hypothetical protein [Streptococcus pyogenes]VGZ08177.1 phage protein [Streptococcus pyogenes]VHA16011.1 phage protein [Streptococcus pyogenes]HEQ9058462.1 hypothetical protein [Streptococcus pyogenes]